MNAMTAAQFNAAYPVGTAVVAYPMVRPEHPAAASFCTRLETRTRSVAWNLGHGEPVVMVEGYAGGIALTHVDVDPTREPVAPAVEAAPVEQTVEVVGGVL